MTVSTISAELLIFLQPNLIVWYIIISWSALFKILIVVFKVKVTERFRIPVNVHLDDVSSAAECSVTKLGMVMQHHGPKCHTRVFCSCLQAGS